MMQRVKAVCDIVHEGDSDCVQTPAHLMSDQETATAGVKSVLVVNCNLPSLSSMALENKNVMHTHAHILYPTKQ